MRQHFVIGIDLDNTLACYDELFHRAACEAGLIEPSLAKSKAAVRDAIRLLPEGEAKWTSLQALVYGTRMNEAVMFAGADVFLEHCAGRCVEVRIVSHKSPCAVLEGKKLDLRLPAMQWLEAKGFFSRFGLSGGHVFFEPTRAEKIERIRALGCTDFIDDLPEVFAESQFPSEVRKWLFAPGSEGDLAPERQPAFMNWLEIDRMFFNDLRP